MDRNRKYLFGRLETTGRKLVEEMEMLLREDGEKMTATQKQACKKIIMLVKMVIHEK